MKRLRTSTIAVAGLLVAAFSAPAHAQKLLAGLTGFREVLPVSTVASGEFKAEIINDTTWLVRQHKELMELPPPGHLPNLPRSSRLSAPV